MFPNASIEEYYTLVYRYVQLVLKEENIIVLLTFHQMWTLDQANRHIEMEYLKLYLAKEEKGLLGSNLYDYADQYNKRK